MNFRELQCPAETVHCQLTDCLPGSRQILGDAFLFPSPSSARPLTLGRDDHHQQQMYLCFFYIRKPGDRGTVHQPVKGQKYDDARSAIPITCTCDSRRRCGDQWRYVGGCGEEVDARIRGMRLITCRLDPGQLTSPVYMYNNKIQTCPPIRTHTTKIPPDIIRGFIGPTITFPYRLIVGRAGGFM